MDEQRGDYAPKERPDAHATEEASSRQPAVECCFWVLLPIPCANDKAHLGTWGNIGSNERPSIS